MMPKISQMKTHSAEFGRVPNVNISLFSGPVSLLVVVCDNTHIVEPTGKLTWASASRVFIGDLLHKHDLLIYQVFQGVHHEKQTAITRKISKDLEVTSQVLSTTKARPLLGEAKFLTMQYHLQFSWKKLSNSLIVRSSTYLGYISVGKPWLINILFWSSETLGNFGNKIDITRVTCSRSYLYIEVLLL